MFKITLYIESSYSSLKKKYNLGVSTLKRAQKAANSQRALESQVKLIMKKKVFKERPKNQLSPLSLTDAKDLSHTPTISRVFY